MSSPCAAPTPGAIGIPQFMPGARGASRSISTTTASSICRRSAADAIGSVATSSGSTAGSRGRGGARGPRHGDAYRAYTGGLEAKNALAELIRAGCNRSADLPESAKPRSSSSNAGAASEYRFRLQELLRHHAVQPQRVLRRCGQRSRRRCARLRARQIAHRIDGSRSLADLECSFGRSASGVADSPRSSGRAATLWLLLHQDVLVVRVHRDEPLSCLIDDQLARPGMPVPL